MKRNGTKPRSTSGRKNRKRRQKLECEEYAETLAIPGEKTSLKAKRRAQEYRWWLKDPDTSRKRDDKGEPLLNSKFRICFGTAAYEKRWTLDKQNSTKYSYCDT